MKSLSDQAGFTLVETLIAIVILSIGILTLYTMQIAAMRANSTADRLTSAATAGADIQERIFSGLYDSGDKKLTLNSFKDINGIAPVLTDADTDGIAGLRNSGCCPDGNDPFGNSVAGCTARADFCWQGPEGYLVYVNIAPEEPMPRTARVAVNVVRSDRGVQKTVTFEHIKAEIVRY